MGNNEVVGPYGAGTVFGAQTPGLSLIRASLALKSTRLGQGLTALGRRWTKGSDALATWGGMEMFLKQQVRQDDSRMERVYAHFQRNLQDILRGGQQTGARIIVSTVASNVKDCAPFASLHRVDLSAAQLATWEKAYQAGIAEQSARQDRAALEHFQKAAGIDDHYADLAYRMGHCALAINQTAEARKYFQIARDRDTLRFRADARINQIIKETASGAPQHGIFLLDGENIIASHSPRQLPGDELFYEHVHLTYEGNYWLGRALAEQVAEWIPRQGISPESHPGEMLTLKECARRLALTEWDQIKVMELHWQRIQEPPFTHQSDWAQRNQRWQARLDQLRPHTTPLDLKRTREVYRSEVAHIPDDPYLRNHFGRLLQAAGDAAGTIEQFRLSLRYLPHNYKTHYYLGNLLHIQGKAHDAQARPYPKRFLNLSQ